MACFSLSYDTLHDGILSHRCLHNDQMRVDMHHRKGADSSCPIQTGRETSLQYTTEPPCSKYDDTTTLHRFR